MLIRAGLLGFVFFTLTACGMGNSKMPTESDVPVDEPETEPDQEDVTLPDWVWEARIGGTSVDYRMSDIEIDYLLRKRKAQNVSVLELDSRLSDYLTDEEFDQEVYFLDRVAKKAHELDMKAVIYYPSLEVLSYDADTSESTMFKDHPDWVQRGLDGTPNVFVGNLEHWVDEGTESAWMSPNSGYRDYFIDRVQKLAATELDGVWVDVPVYLETATKWPGAEPPAAAAFKQWSRENELGGPDGYDVPSAPDFNDPRFRAWIKWRHVNIADFLEDIRRSALEINPDFMVAIESFPVDNVDAMSVGLDGLYRVNRKNFFRVWEIDSVSNTKAMQWATYEDFNSKIAQNKFARACERENPAWVFSYGNEPLDAGLVMAAAVATGVAPFESKTPEMTESVGEEFRTRWFGYIAEYAKELFRVPRAAQAAVWYSGATRDYIDYPVGGNWGMYITVENPNADPDWWASADEDSALGKPHLGGYRGSLHALTRLGVPHKIVVDPGAPEKQLEDVPFLMLPSVAAISDESAEVIRNYVSNGGVVFATGRLPGTMDENGAARSSSVLADVFGFGSGTTSEARATSFGDGVAVYRPDVEGTNMYAKAVDADAAADATSALEKLLRIHVPDMIRFDAPSGIFVDVGIESETKHHLYVINYTGLQQPLVESPQDMTLHYRPPTGFRVASATASSPDEGGQNGNVNVVDVAQGEQGLQLHVEQFALVTLTLEATDTPVGTYAGPTFSNTAWKTAAEAGIDFIKNRMRNASAPAPWSFGVFTNFRDDYTPTEIYAHGHHVTAEHMGLALRVAACMKDTDFYNESFRYVNELQQSPVYGVVNWAMDKDALRPLVQPDDYSPQWLSANAPLDDFRVVRGLMAGARQIDNMEAGPLADNILRGLYWTSVTDRDRDSLIDYPQYPGGIIGYAWDWAETDDGTMAPPATSSGLGRLTSYLVPVDYSDLYTIGLAARRDSRWQGVLEEGTEFLLASEIASTGLYYNGFTTDGEWTGDFENRDTNQGQHLKVIQVLWIALHLARAATFSDLLPAGTRNTARASAQRALTFFKDYYNTNGRVPEYLKYDGTPVDDCVSENNPALCLRPGWENLVDGEVRIYAQMGRLALWLDDDAFAAKMVDERLLTDRVTNPSDARYGQIGVSTAADNDAEAWNVLESVLTICQVAGGE